MSSFRTNRLGQATKKTGSSEFSSFMISAPPARNPVTRRVKRANVANPSQVPQRIVSQSVPNMTSREQGFAVLQPSPDVVDQNSNVHNVSLGQQSFSQRSASSHTLIAANQQTSIDQQPNLDQQNQPPNLQQLMTRQNNLPIAQQQQLGSQSNVSGLCYKQSAQVMPQSKVSLQQRPQQAGATMIASQSQQFQLTKPPLHGVSGYLQKVVEQQNQSDMPLTKPPLHRGVPGSLQKVVEQQNQSDRPLTEPASGFTDPTSHANGGDWQEDVYLKIQSIKARYLPVLHQIHRNVVAWLEKTATLTTQPYEDQTEKVRRIDTKLQCCINLLKCSKSDISPGLKEKWPLYEKYILGCVTSYGTRKPMPSHHNSMARLQNTSVSPRTRSNTISLKGNAATSSGSLQTNSGSRNNNSLSSKIAVDMLHPSVKSHMAHSSMVPHQHQKKELEQKSVRCHFSVVTAATSSFKRQKIEATVPLLKEIKEINRQLYDTIVDVVDEITDPSAIAVSSKGTFVTFSTFPVTLSPRLKSHFSAHGLQIQPLLLLVPSSYPNCSPILIDDVSADISNKVEDLGSKARTRFKLTLATLSKPKSLKEIARIWEGCVLAVISEYANQLGDSLLHLPG